jgi:hypothetical protein
MRAVLLAALGVLERVLDYIDDAKGRIELRGFLKDHPEATFYETSWTDGTD